MENHDAMCQLIDDVLRRRAAILRYAAIQFIALTGAAMIAYAGGNWYAPSEPRYQIAHNFLSDLGATVAFSGQANTLSAALFFIALASIGAALIPFAWTGREFGPRARAAAWIKAIAGTLSGLCFAGVAFTPENLALTAHTTFVVAAFGFLLIYVIALTWLMAANGRGGLFVNIAHLACVATYVVVILFGPRLDTEHGFTVQVVAQKLVVYLSMLHIVYLTTAMRRLAAP